jgi:murein DD-endopeptidase MepM/ murein hydrolase activator NlpD
VVIVEHAPGWVTLYAHSESLKVGEGEDIPDDAVVATVGESGHTTGPHLHFELRHQGVPVDPLIYLGPPPVGAR